MLRLLGLLVQHSLWEKSCLKDQAGSPQQTELQELTQAWGQMPPPPLASWQGRYDSRGAPKAAAIAPNTMAHSPLKVALLGAGGFVRDAYLDPLRANSGLLLLQACWSRSERSVEELAQAVRR